jgi:hypothetical protein
LQIQIKDEKKRREEVATDVQNPTNQLLAIFIFKGREGDLEPNYMIKK